MMDNKTCDNLINEMGEIIYVCDPGTYELLFVNDYGRRLCALQEYRGLTCYEAIQGKNAPCAFCAANLPNQDDFHVWEFTNPLLKRHLLLKSKLFIWQGRQARLEICVDITERENISRNVQKKLKAEHALVNCIRRLFDAANLEQSMEAVLSAIGDFYQSDRSYILELDQCADLGSNTFEWCAEGIPSHKDFLQNVPMKTLPFWRDAMHKRSVVLISVSELKDKYPFEYGRMSMQGIECLMAVPFFMEEKGVGYLGIDNPRFNRTDPSLLESLTYFIVNEMHKRRMQATLEYQSYHDVLTGLSNRTQYNDDLRRMNANPPGSMGVVFCDMNGLKQINDSFGHLRGDQAISQTADILIQSFPQGQIYRLSGDEFVVLCPDTSRELFVMMVSFLRDNFSANDISVSIGYAWEDSDIDITLLIHHADERMYIHKQNYYKETTPADRRRDPEMLNSLLNSLQAGEYEMFLQPKADITSKKIIGAEALARLHDPEYGLISPDKFIPILEEAKVIKYLDLFMFEEVCKALSQWRTHNVSLIPVSVNFSRITIMQSGIVDEITQISSRYNIPPRYIEIEITESVGSIEHGMIAEVCINLKEAGFPLSLDDFGNRYSSMSLLTVIEPDALKLDRSLIRDLTANPRTCILTSSLIELCEHLHIKSIAEGVETVEQLKLLKKLKCNVAQGYLFGRPISRAEFEKRFLGNQGSLPAS